MVAQVCTGSAVSQARTPINVFALAMMACAALLGLSATQISGCDSRTAFTYTIHAFLAVAGMCFVTLLFCPSTIYHPRDLAQADQTRAEGPRADRPGIAAALIMLMLLAYGWYQFNRGDPCAVTIQGSTEHPNRLPFSSQKTTLGA